MRKEYTLAPNQDIDLHLKRIAGILLLNASFIESPGLLNGKLGITIFFYHYYRYTGNEIYNEFAGELIDQIYEEINTSIPVNFEDGLTGIGWGIEYLVKNRLVDADTDEALAEIDNTLYRRRLNSAILIDESNSIFGYGLYYLSRLTGHNIDNNDLNTLIKKYHLIFLIDECERILIQKSYEKFIAGTLGINCLNSFLAFLLEVHRLRIYPYKTEKLLEALPGLLKEAGNSENKTGKKIATHLLKRLAGYGVIQSSEFDKICRPDSANNLNVAIEAGFDINIGEWINYIWQILIYRSVLNGEGDRNVSVVDLQTILKEENELNKMFDKVNKNKLGLSGMAGLGMLFLQGAGSGGQGAGGKGRKALNAER